MLILFALFAVAILLCVLCGISVLYALTFGYLILFFYDRQKGCSCKDLLVRSWKGIYRVKNVFLNYILVGMITALWRVCGTIPFLTYHSLALLRPRWFALLAFLLCAGFSMLTGTAFGSASTIGLLCMIVGNSLGVEPIILGGAIISGIRVGDRCSPVSTSALLISEVTGTDIYHNIKNMLRTALLPFLISCVIYFLLGHTAAGQTDMATIRMAFASHFSLSPFCALPVVAVIVMALRHISTRKLFVGCVLLSFGIAVFCEGRSVLELIPILVVGYHPAESQLAAFLNGGGVVSVSTTLGIVLLSSTYLELIQVGGLLEGVENQLRRVAELVGSFGTILFVAVLIALISCNQTLTIMLTASLCVGIEPNSSRLAAALADSASIMPALIPWSVACALPLSTIGAPTASVFLAVYIYLIPLCRPITGCFVQEVEQKGRKVENG